MTVKYNYFSADDHVVESPDCYVNRLPKAMQTQAPRIETIDGSDVWVSDGQRLAPACRTGSQVGIPIAERGDREETTATYASVRPGVWNPAARAKDFDDHAVYGGVLFPDFFSSFGNPFHTLGDRYDLRLACVRAHNDYVVEEFCAGAPGRYIPLALIPVWSVEDSVAEVHRVAKLGHKGVCWGGSMDVFGMPWFGDTHWDPLWAAIQENNIVLAMHRFGQAASMGRSTLPKERSHAMRLVGTGNSMSAAIFPTNELIASGILERFPRMKVLVAEGGATWLPYVLQQLDWHVDQVIANAGAHLSMLPSDYARRQVWTCFWYEKIDPTTLKLLGEDKVCWQQDYPHPQCTWPLVEQTADYSLEPIKDERLRKMLRYENCARLFGFDTSGFE
jgi:predicted TIM-barrel fold metal-dependent hydrolase